MEINILTQRPEDMPYEQYKLQRTIQKKFLKHYLKGKVVFLSKLYPSQEVIKELTESKMLETVGQLMFKGTSYRKEKK